MDFDGPRFCFQHLWAELLLTYSDFLLPDDRELQKKRRKRHREMMAAKRKEIGVSTPNDAATTTTNEAGKKDGNKDADLNDDEDDVRVVHGFDSAGFLKRSPPSWRPFLRSLLATNLFQQFNHNACEAALHRSRNPRRPAIFFDRLTRVKTLNAARLMVENTLSAFEDESASSSGNDDGSLLSSGEGHHHHHHHHRRFYDRVGPPRPLPQQPEHPSSTSGSSNDDAQHQRYSESLWQNGSLRRWQRKRQMFYAYTAFPSLSRDWGEGIAPTATTTPPAVPSSNSSETKNGDASTKRRGQSSSSSSSSNELGSDGGTSQRKRASSAVEISVSLKPALNGGDASELTTQIVESEERVPRESLSVGRGEVKASGSSGSSSSELWLAGQKKNLKAILSLGDGFTWLQSPSVAVVVDAANTKEVDADDGDDDDEVDSQDEGAHKAAAAADNECSDDEGDDGIPRRAWMAWQESADDGNGADKEGADKEGADASNNADGSQEDSVLKSLFGRFGVEANLQEKQMAEQLSERDFSDDEESSGDESHKDPRHGDSHKGDRRADHQSSFHFSVFTNGSNSNGSGDGDGGGGGATGSSDGNNNGTGNNTAGSLWSVVESALFG